jgi:hypothetical protein
LTAGNIDAYLNAKLGTSIGTESIIWQNYQYQHAYWNMKLEYRTRFDNEFADYPQNIKRTIPAFPVAGAKESYCGIFPALRGLLMGD